MLELAANGGSSMITLKRTNASNGGAKGGIRFTENTNGYNVGTIACLGDGANTSGALCFYTKASSTTTGVYLATTDERMRISSSGNVGIGTSSPGVQLHIQGTSPRTLSTSNGPSYSDYGQLVITDTTAPSGTGVLGNLKIGYDASTGSFGTGFLQCVNPNTYSGPLVLQPYGGNVGIGTTDPLGNLHIRGENVYLQSALVSNCTWRIMPQTGNATKLFRIYDQDNAADRLVINASGYVGIGTINPVAKLIVNAYGSEQSTNCLIIGAGTGSQNLRIGVHSSSNYCWIQSHAGKPLRLNPAGNTIQYGTGNTTLSDDRIKDNEMYIENATDTLLKLKPQVYDKKLIWNISKLGETSNVNVVRESGLITQDVWYDAPELRHLVHLGEDAEPGEDKPVTDNDPTIDPDYTSWGDNVSLIEYTGLIPYLIKSNQEIYTELQAEKAKVADLLARVEALENA
jgi:hypothetical protein